MRKLWIILMRAIFTAGNANDQSCPGGFNRLDKLFFKNLLTIPAGRAIINTSTEGGNQP